MFGFLRPHAPQAKNVRPAATDPQPSTAILVSREDIYRENRGLEPILLLRKGMEISPADLPRFIRNGARPHQFIFKHHIDQYHTLLDTELATAPTPPIDSHPIPWIAPQSSTSIIPMSPPRQRRQAGKSIAKPLIGINQQTAVILEPDPKNMKRLIDCLFICGMTLDQLHPVRVPNYLRWSLEKYAPQILLLDYKLPNGANSLDLLWKIAQQAGLPAITILTLPAQATLSNREQQLLQRLSATENIQILPKPVSRFALYRLLQTELGEIEPSLTPEAKTIPYE